MNLQAYTDRIPGATIYTPNTQFGVNQSPRLGGLGTASASGIFQSAQDLVVANPIPVLGIIAFLLFTRR